MMKLALMRTATGKEYPELSLLQRTSSLELTAPQIVSQINADTSQPQLFRGDCVNQAFMVELLQTPLKNTNKNKTLAWAKKHKQWTLDQWISVLWSNESKFEIFSSNRCVFVTRGVGERMISACVFPTANHGGGGVRGGGCFASDTGCDLFRIQGTFNQHGFHSILQRYAIPSGLGLVGL